MAGQFNLLDKSLKLTIDNASKAAQKLLEAITPDNSRALIEASEALGLGITGELSSKADEMAMREMEAEEDPNAQQDGEVA